MKHILTTLILILTLLPAAAQERGFRVSLRDTDHPFHESGAGLWQGGSRYADAPLHGLTVHYLSGTFLLSTDFDTKGKIRNFHANPHFHLNVQYLSGKGFRTQLRLYPVVGVTDVGSRDCRFDYGAALSLTAGWKVGIGILGRITRDTMAAGVSIAF